MPIKKPARKSAKKPMPKKRVAAKIASKPKRKAPKVKKGDSLSCSSCGILIRVDEECGCMDTCDIVCCGESMRLVCA